MVLLTGYFITVAYNGSVSNTEAAELEFLQVMTRTFALQIDADALKAVTPETKHADVSQTKREMMERIFMANTINNLDNGLAIVLLPENDAQVEIISEHGTRSLDESKSNISLLLAERPSKAISLDLSQTLNESHIFFAYPLSLRELEGYSGYIVAEESIEKALRQARADFFKHLGLSLLALAAIGFLSYRSLKRILNLEMRSKRKLRQYASLAEARKDELETLSFVISKSENLILLTDKAGRIIWINESYSRRNNYSNDELNNFVGRELAEVSQYPKINEVISTVVLSKQKTTYEAKSFDANNNEFWASTTVTPILNENGEVDKLLFIDADITRLKIAENEISKLANFAQENSKPLIRLHKSGHVIYSNKPGEIILQHWHTKLNERIKKPGIRDMIAGVYETGFEKTINIEQNSRIFSLRFFPVQEKEYVNVYGEDITEVKAAEKESIARALQLEQHNLNITDSITYARRIQEAIIPGEDHIRRFFKDSFAISKPKDIVSGDFFWLYEVKPKSEYLLALADCTGHGVPGAMMSIIGHSSLNEIVETHGLTDPALILEHLNVEIIRTLRQKSQAEAKDGMDVSIIHINLETLMITFAGAYQHMYWMNGKLNIIKGDRQPIGGLHHNDKRKFHNHTFKVSKGDAIYLSSDGFADQFGGPDDKKFLARRLAEMITQNHKYSMQAQSHRYDQAFEAWRGSGTQIDDVSLLGIKF